MPKEYDDPISCDESSPDTFSGVDLELEIPPSAENDPEANGPNAKKQIISDLSPTKESSDDPDETLYNDKNNAIEGLYYENGRKDETP